MDEKNPEIEASFDALANICCDALNGNNDEGLERTDALLKSLLMSGYHRSKDRVFQVDLENRVNEKCRDRAIHRGGELSSLSTILAKKFTELARWDSKTPEDESPSQAAHIRATTDS